jgi:hypothetical protein
MQGCEEGEAFWLRGWSSLACIEPELSSAALRCPFHPSLLPPSLPVSPSQAICSFVPAQIDVSKLQVGGGQGQRARAKGERAKGRALQLGTSKT